MAATKQTQKTMPARMLTRNPGPMPVGFTLTLLVILGFGLVMLFSASYVSGYLTQREDSYHYIRPQAIFAAVGLVVMWLASRVDYHWLRRWVKLGYLVCLILLVWALTCEPLNECRRWIHYSKGPLSVFPTVQPSEIVKFEMALLTADLMCYFRKKRKTFLYGVIVPLLPLIPVVPLMMLEPHLSGTVVICAIVGTVMLLGGSGGIYLIALGLIGGGGGWALLSYAREHIDYIARRLSTWTWDLELMPWQTKQSLFAIGSGGFSGVGFGKSMEKQLWLPECENDFIFSVICEELGFLGALAVIILFLLLIVQGLYIAYSAPDLFGNLLGFGIVGQIMWQVIFNIGVVTNAIPNTGISLPFFSYGGTSLLMLLAEMGVLLSIGRAGHKARLEREEAEEQKKQAELKQASMGSYSII